MTDAAGRAVELPATVMRVATVGAVPVINSFILALGKGETIVNGLPLFAQSKRYKYHQAFAPTLVGKPVVQGPAGDPNVETLMTLRPDVVLTMDRLTAESLERKGLAVVVLTWREPEDIKATMALLGEILGVQARADQYIEYFNGAIRRVDAVVSSIPNEQRSKVLFGSLKGMNQPHLIADWWIDKAGGISVTADGRRTESVAFSIEHILAWNPDVLLVGTPAEIEIALQDKRLGGISAVRHKRVYTVPVGAHTWSHRTAEQPLMVLWAAKTFYPDRFANLDLHAEIKTFYARFFEYELSDEQITEMLTGIP